MNTIIIISTWYWMYYLCTRECVCLWCVVVLWYSSHCVQQTGLEPGLSYQHHHMNLITINHMKFHSFDILAILIESPFITHLFWVLKSLHNAFIICFCTFFWKTRWGFDVFLQVPIIRYLWVCNFQCLQKCCKIHWPV